jgi:G3E family GTPase
LLGGERETFWVDDGLGSLVRLHQTVALVDAKNFPSKFKSDKLAKEEEKSETSLLSEEPAVTFTEKEAVKGLLYPTKSVQTSKFESETFP